MTRHFIDLADFDGATLRAMLDDAKARKQARAGMPRGMPDADRRSKGHVLALIFDKPFDAHAHLLRHRRCTSSAAATS